MILKFDPYKDFSSRKLRFLLLCFDQENSRLYAGKQIHPFFSSCKSGKKTQEVIDLEGKQVAVSRDNKVINCGPIHVFEKIEVSSYCSHSELSLCSYFSYSVVKLRIVDAGQ